MTFFTILFLSALGATIALFVIAVLEERAGRRLGGHLRARADEALGLLAGRCRECVAPEARARACSFVARCCGTIVGQFSRIRVRAPGAIIAQRATSVMFAGRRALVATQAASPFLRKMAGYKEKKDLRV